MNFFRLIKLIALMVFLFGVGITALISGTRKRQQYQDHQKRYPAPVTISATELVRTQPREGWFRVTGVTTFADEAAGIRNDPDKHIDNGDGSGTIDQVFIPAYDAGATNDKGAGMVLLTDHLRLRKVLNEMHKLGFSESATLLGGVKSDEVDDTDSATKPITPFDPAKFDKWVLKNADRLEETRVIEGMVRSRDDLELDNAALYDSVRTKAAVRHVLLEEGVTPTTDDNGGFDLGLGTVFGLIWGSIVLFFVNSIAKGWREGVAESAKPPVIAMPRAHPEWKQNLDE